MESMPYGHVDDRYSMTPARVNSNFGFPVSIRIRAISSLLIQAHVPGYPFGAYSIIGTALIQRLETPTRTPGKRRDRRTAVHGEHLAFIRVGKCPI